MAYVSSASGSEWWQPTLRPAIKCFFCRRNQQNLCDDLLFNNGAYAEYIRIPARIVEKEHLSHPRGAGL